ncbi:MAG: sigma-70 family RNA polymerase sigma factor [Vicinamibacterales bacterium]
MLGSIVDAEDAVQDTMIRAWQSRDRFEGRASLKTWLYRIATNVCLDRLSDNARRARPMEDGPRGTVDSALETRTREHWLEPVPDARVLPADADPFELTSLRQSIRLAFVSALQHLPPRQRAALLLTEVLGWSAAEAAAGLDTSVAAVNSALQRARATLAGRDAGTGPASPLTETELGLLDRFMRAFERYDVDTLVSLLKEDATMSMPPYALWLQGPADIRAWLLGPGIGCRGSRLVPVEASGVPGFGQYRPAADGHGHTPWALVVAEVEGDRLTSWNSFLDTDTLFPIFGLPSHLPPA